MLFYFCIFIKSSLHNFVLDFLNRKERGGGGVEGADKSSLHLYLHSHIHVSMGTEREILYAHATNNRIISLSVKVPSQ